MGTIILHSQRKVFDDSTWKLPLLQHAWITKFQNFNQWKLVKQIQGSHYKMKHIFITKLQRILTYSRITCRTLGAKERKCVNLLHIEVMKIMKQINKK